MKTLVLQFAQAITTWLTGKKVVQVEIGTTDLPRLSDEIRSDMVFLATPEEEGKFILHMEFQGEKTKIPMPRRELDYLSRLSDIYPGLPILSIVLYIGKGAGSKDTGQHVIWSPDGTPSLAWNYRVVHLWKIVADDVVETAPVAVLALIGQMQMNNPQQVLQTVVKRVNEVEDTAIRHSLLQSMFALIGDKGVLKMLETLLIPESVLGETPFMERMRLSEEEGIQKGIQIGREEGVQEGLQKGLLEGITLALELKFGENGLSLLPEMYKIKNLAMLRALYQFIRIAKTVEDVEKAIQQLNAADDALNRNGE